MGLFKPQSCTQPAAAYCTALCCPLLVSIVVRHSRSAPKKESCPGVGLTAGVGAWVCVAPRRPPEIPILLRRHCRRPKASRWLSASSGIASQSIVQLDKNIMQEAAPILPPRVPDSRKVAGLQDGRRSSSRSPKRVPSIRRNGLLGVPVRNWGPCRVAAWALRTRGPPSRNRNRFTNAGRVTNWS